MVMPRSRSSALESMTRSTICSLARKVPLCFSMASTSVVLPWSTWAMMAMLRILVFKTGFFLGSDYKSGKRCEKNDDFQSTACAALARGETDIAARRILGALARNRFAHSSSESRSLALGFV